MGFAGLLLYAAASDIATMTIPNWVSIAAIALFFPAALAVGASPMQIGAHALTGAIVFAVGLGLFCAGVMGGGDVKVITAVSFWTGAAALGPFALWTAVAGGGLALFLLVARRIASPREGQPQFLNRLLGRQTGIPYAVAIAAGALLTFSDQPIPRLLF